MGFVPGDPEGHHGLHPWTGGHLAHRNPMRSMGDPRDFSAWVGAIRSESEKLAAYIQGQWTKRPSLWENLVTQLRKKKGVGSPCETREAESVRCA